MNSYISLRSNYSISLIAYATLVFASFWGLYAMAPGWAKALFSFCMWLAIFAFPYKLIRSNDFVSLSRWLLGILMVMTVLQILRTAFSDDRYLYLHGNKWFTLFGNEYTALMLIVPLFAYLGTLQNSVSTLMRVTYSYLLFGLFLSVLGKFPIAHLSIFVTLFYPYINKKYRFLIIAALAEALISATLLENTGRMFFLVLFFALCTYCVVMFKIKIKYLKIFAVCIAIAPILMFIPTLTLSDGEESTFGKIQNYVLQKSGDDSLAGDTRTFLYIEMGEELTTSDAWLFGKGAYSIYYSPFFDSGGTTSLGRISSEVPFLTHILRGGISYAFVYYGLILLAVYLAIWRGRNKFVRAIGIVLLGWYFNCFVGDITGCRFYHLAVFLLLGCCLSNKWRNFTDNEIQMVISWRNTIKENKKQYMPNHVVKHGLLRGSLP